MVEPMVVLVGYHRSSNLNWQLKIAVGKKYEIIALLDPDVLEDVLPDKPRLAVLIFSREILSRLDLFEQRTLLSNLQKFQDKFRLLLIGANTVGLFWKAGGLSEIFDLHTASTDPQTIVDALANASEEKV